MGVEKQEIVKQSKEGVPPQSPQYGSKTIRRKLLTGRLKWIIVEAYESGIK
jgi:hypothetical protein